MLAHGPVSLSPPNLPDFETMADIANELPA